MSWKKLDNPRRFLKDQVVLAATLSAVLVVVLVGAVLYIANTDDGVEVASTPIEAQDIVKEEPEQVEQEPGAITVDAEELQRVLDEWESVQSGKASVVITDVAGEELASINGDDSYFAASIYKVYVAYEGYREVDLGNVDPDDIYLGQSTRLECLDLMIRESDSPCAEKMWVELGKQNLTEIMQSYGLENTSMTGITTSAADAAIILSRIARGQGLSLESQKNYLVSMREQIYRDAFNKGFSDKVVVYNKIGFNEDQEYHDTAIIELEDGRLYVVSALTNGVGPSNIANLGERLEQVFLAE